MRKYIKYVSLAVLLIATWGCNNMEVGFLDTSCALYSPKTMVVRKELDMNNWEDMGRADKKAHWISPKIQGVQGTAPVIMTIHSVKVEGGGNVSEFLKYTTLRSNGQFDVKYENEIPIGKYIISIKVTNDGYESVLEDIFAVDIRQK